MATIIKVSGERIGIFSKNKKDFKLEEAQAIVGGLIEIIHLGNGKILVIDEEGKFKEKEINVIATIIAHQENGILPTDVIVGDVLLCKDKEIL